MLSNENPIIPSVNFHLWEPCNMRCKFCFARFQDVTNSILPKGHLPREEAIMVVRELANLGFEKITFAGGEPTLCPWLPELMATAKELGLTTMIVSNGSYLDEKFLIENRNNLDWIAVSIDSLDAHTNISMGRAVTGKRPLHADYYHTTVDMIKSLGYGLKINTVVTKLNYQENMSDLINYAKPKRWKVLQVLPIVGQNDSHIDQFKINDSEFQQFLKTHEHLGSVTNIVTENNEQMKSSYVMVDPAGRFFDNASGTHHYSDPILEVGASNAIRSMNYDLGKFLRRGGLYNWKMAVV
ncbi:MAG: radical S-adenosyl methionine domain-containing protein 2 [Cyclobacteriaceae bacterium]|jgi:radical S-adenosyl methionine domain-containing protein 2